MGRRRCRQTRTTKRDDGTNAYPTVLDHGRHLSTGSRKRSTDANIHSDPLHCTRNAILWIFLGRSLPGGRVALYLPAASNRSTEPHSVTAHTGDDRSASDHNGYSITSRAKTVGLEPGQNCLPHVATASTYIRSSANGSNPNPAYSWQLGSKMDGTRLAYG